MSAPDGRRSRPLRWRRTTNSTIPMIISALRRGADEEPRPRIIVLLPGKGVTTEARRCPDLWPAAVPVGRLGCLRGRRGIHLLSPPLSGAAGGG